MITENISNRSLENWLIHHLLGSYYIAIVPNYFIGNWECDVFSLNKSGYTAEYEIKQTKTDYLKDFEKRRYGGGYVRSNKQGYKHDFIKEGKRTNRFWFVLPEDMDVEVPDYAGRINYTTKYGWVTFQIKKPAPLLHKNKATEKQKNQMLSRLTFKYYREMMKRTKYHDKYQLNL